MHVNEVTPPYIYHKSKVKVKKKNPKRIVSLEFLHQSLGHKYRISLLAEDTANVWQDIDLIIYPERLFTSYQIPTI